MNVLIVDDDEVDRERVKRILKRSQSAIQITEASTVDKGIEAYNSNAFDIVLLDYKMPRRDGIEMLKELRCLPKDGSVAIVMMSTSEDEQLALECLRFGAQDFVPKSDITKARLSRAIAHAHTRFELEKELWQSYKKVKQLAESDSLTGLANRYLFDETLKSSIQTNERAHHKIALVLFDIDNFKFVNDTFGHHIGDALLQRTVTRVKSCMRGNELFYRLGGDEFGIIIPTIDEIKYVHSIVNRIKNIFVKPFEIESVKVTSSVSIGIAIHPDNGNTAQELYKQADIAMYRAKKQGKNLICFFEHDMQEQFSKHYLIEQQLRESIVDKSFFLVYQPILHSNQYELAGVEALLRWEYKSTIRAPDTFISVAEDTNLIREIGKWVIQEAFKKIAEWHSLSDLQPELSLNLSPKQLVDEQLVDFIQAELNHYELNPRHIQFELTETAFLDNSPEIVANIHKISDLGCKIALDDFGTGFSSISHLRNFPIDTVKIDKSILPKDNSNEKEIALMNGLCMMIKALKLNIVAEGVETEYHKQLCHSFNVDKLQGFYFSKPISPKEITSNYFAKENLY